MIRAQIIPPKELYIDVDDLELDITETYLGNPNVRRSYVEKSMSAMQQSEFIKCRKSIIYFASNYIKIISVDDGLIQYKPYKFQKKLLKLYQKNRYTVALQCRQSGKSTTTAIFLLWYALFHKHKEIGILANKDDQSKEIMSRIIMYYEYLPFFLQQGATALNKKALHLENGSKIFSAATSSSSIRGKSLSICYLDEFAFVENDVEFWTSTYPVICSGKKSRVIITSTPNGKRGMFHKIYLESTQRKNSFLNIKVLWHHVPGRDDKWRKECIKQMGSEEQFMQEMECVTGNTDVTIRSKITGEVETIKISDLYYRLLCNKMNGNFDQPTSERDKKINNMDIITRSVNAIEWNDVVDSDKSSVVYAHRNKRTGKIYVGQTIGTAYDRWMNHKSSADYEHYHGKRKSYFHNALLSTDEWDHAILYEGTELNHMEKHFISIFDSFGDHGYNLNSGGSSGGHVNGTVKVRDDEGNVITVSVDDPRYISGEFPYFHKGMKRSNKTCRLISAKRREKLDGGWKQPDIWDNLSNEKQEEIRRKQSETRKGNLYGNVMFDDIEYESILSKFGIDTDDDDIGKINNAGMVKTYEKSFAEYMELNHGKDAKTVDRNIRIRPTSKSRISIYNAIMGDDYSYPDSRKMAYNIFIRVHGESNLRIAELGLTVSKYIEDIGPYWMQKYNIGPHSLMKIIRGDMKCLR